MTLELKFVIAIVVCSWSGATFAQSHEVKPNVDSAFRVAREKIFYGNREEGRIILLSILNSAPDFHDGRVLLARSYAWDDNLSGARNELLSVLQKKPNHPDALGALYDVEVWDGKYADALGVINIRLKYDPNSADLLYKKAVVLFKLNDTKEALLTLDDLNQIDPGHEEGRLLREKINISALRYEVGLSYGVDVFSRTFDPAQVASLQVSRSNNWGASILRFNYASRISLQGLQTEIDIYPKIGKGAYVYANYGYSSSILFSKHRMGLEIYTRLPHRLETSGGLRYLHFDSDKKVIIYTGSLGWYFKNYWISYRPYITPDEAGTTFSSSLTARRYFKRADSYLGVSGNIGFSPDERRIQSGSGLSSDVIYVLQSQNMGLTWQHNFFHKWTLNAMFTLIHQEVAVDIRQYVWINSYLLGVKRKL